MDFEALSTAPPRGETPRGRSLRARSQGLAAGRLAAVNVVGRVIGAAAGAACLLGASAALADEPRGAREPYLWREPGDIVNVIDSFDDGDVFDINVSLGFDFQTKSARIFRETSRFDPGLTTGGFTSTALPVADYGEQTSRLTPRLEVGLYKDLAVYMSLPIVLSNTRNLARPNGQSDATYEAARAGQPGELLFDLPFRAPDRSGVENITAGLHFNILNQFRDPSKPTWLFGVEGRFSVGTPMSPCNASPKTGQIACADPSDINRNGVGDGGFEGTNPRARTPGITRGTIGLEAHTYMSKRIKYIEPYGGFSALVELPDSQDYSLSNLEGSLVNMPPIVGTVVLGMMIHPWENREKAGRLTLDLRFMGSYRSEGRDFSELYDLLGSSDAPSVRNPNWSKYKANPTYSGGPCTDNDPSTPCQPRSVIDEQSQRSYYTGLADVQAFGSYRGSGAITWQASQYVKFTAGFGVRFDQGHQITGDQPCNPAFKGDITKSGFCQSGNVATQDVAPNGIPNPNFRPSINQVGRRYLVDDSVTVDVFANGVVMF